MKVKITDLGFFFEAIIVISHAVMNEMKFLLQFRNSCNIDHLTDSLFRVCLHDVWEVMRPSTDLNVVL